jgi:hypothetical protein
LVVLLILPLVEGRDKSGDKSGHKSRAGDPNESTLGYSA